MFSTIAPYNWNIVENGVKHHNPNALSLAIVWDKMEQK
jgi:hypothetical protein